MVAKIKKYRRGIGHWISSDSGQRFFNFMYSIGAAIVIWGALFKILHMPYGNTLLSIGMGTEVLMFVLTAFDRPPREYAWHKVFPALDKKDGEPSEAVDTDFSDLADATEPQPATIPSAAEAKAAVGLPQSLDLAPDDAQTLSESIARMSSASEQLARMAELTEATQQYLQQIGSIATEMQHLRDTTEQLNQVQETLLGSYQAITQNSSSISSASTGYADQMQALNRNIAGLNTIYEIQLKGVSGQIDAIDRVNRGIKDIRDMYEKSAAQSVRYCEETERMARYMQQLNGIYERMIHAMTVNMYNPMAPGMPPAATQDNK